MSISPTSARKRPEEILQRQVVGFLRLAAPNALWFAVPNQRGTRDRWEQALLKAMGVRAGVADLVFVLDGGRVAFIELKSGTGRLSAEQALFQEHCERLGAPYLVCRSLAEVEGALAAWRVPLKGRVVE